MRTMKFYQKSNFFSFLFFFGAIFPEAIRYIAPTYLEFILILFCFIYVYRKVPFLPSYLYYEEKLLVY